MKKYLKHTNNECQIPCFPLFFKILVCNKIGNYWTDTRITCKNPLVPVTSPMIHPCWKTLYVRYLTTNHAVSTFENTCRATLNNKRHKRKNTMPLNPNQTFNCSHCDHACLSCINFIIHKTWLQSTWTTSFLIFVPKAKPFWWLLKILGV